MLSILHPHGGYQASAAQGDCTALVVVEPCKERIQINSRVWPINKHLPRNHTRELQDHLDIRLYRLVQYSHRSSK